MEKSDLNAQIYPLLFLLVFNAFCKGSNLGIQMAQTLFACYCTKVNPDATMTPQFTKGLVKGYTCNRRP